MLCKRFLAVIATCHAAMVAPPPSGFVWSTVPGLGYASVAVHDALLSRRTINDFAPELPADWEASLLRAVEAATYAPNHKRTEPVRRPLQSPNHDLPAALRTLRRRAVL